MTDRQHHSIVPDPVDPDPVDVPEKSSKRPQHVAPAKAVDPLAHSLEARVASLTAENAVLKADRAPGPVLLAQIAGLQAEQDALRAAPVFAAYPRWIYGPHPGEAVIVSDEVSWKADYAGWSDVPIPPVVPTPVTVPIKAHAGTDK